VVFLAVLGFGVPLYLAGRFGLLALRTLWHAFGR
jgi:hypothetical protein